MKLFFKHCILLTSIMLFYSCGRKPKPCAFIDMSQTQVGDTITFDCNCSELINTCSWDFGDGQKAELVTDTFHVYNTAGVYKVELTAINKEKSAKKIYTLTITN